VQHAAVEEGGDLLFDGALEDGVFSAFVGDFGDVAEVDLAIRALCRRILKADRLHEGSSFLSYSAHICSIGGLSYG
jgi:hypothetical protein